MATLIAHFYNESYLLPHFIRHHLPLFERAVLIDYASTDDSVAICHELAPHWEVRPSRNAEFSAQACDAEVMDIERSLPAGEWKMTLNVTEFLACSDLPSFTSDLEAQGLNGATLRPFIMVDPLSLRNVPVDPLVPLVEQRHHGLPSYAPTPWGTPYEARRSRLLHRHSDGAYDLGRHNTAHQDVAHHPIGVAILWWGFSPWTTELRARRLQIQDELPASDRAAGFGVQHFVDEALLQQRYETEASAVIDLRAVPEYIAATK